MHNGCANSTSSGRTAQRVAHVGGLDDECLIALVRAGELDADTAYAELWRRHFPPALSAARRITKTFDPADLASEAFVRVLVALRRGKGPDLSFRAYLIVTMRNIAAAWARQEARLAVQGLGDFDALPQTAAGPDRLDTLAGLEALRSLPERWRKVLWYSEVEDLNPAELGELFGITASAAAMLAFRARQGLRKAWQASAEVDAPVHAVHAMHAARAVHAVQ